MKKYMAMLLGAGALSLISASSMASERLAENCLGSCQSQHVEDASDYSGLMAQFYDQNYVSQHGKFYNARFPNQVKATGNKFFVFSPRMRQWAAYDGSGQLLKTGRANGGNSYCDDLGRSCRSPRGWFTVNSKGSESCKSSKFPVGKGGAPMPYCMFFHGGYAIHGSPGISQYNTSHGCIRVTTESARWLSQDFMNVGTKVLILPY